MDKVREFWKHKINPITGFRAGILPTSKEILTPILFKPDQASVFKPKGFR